MSDRDEVPRARWAHGRPHRHQTLPKSPSTLLEGSLSRCLMREYSRRGSDRHHRIRRKRSAAYPLFLPSLDRVWSFERRDRSATDERVQLTDGGVYDNLATSCFDPGRSPAYSYNQYDVGYIVACDAGPGLLDAQLTYGWASRVKRSLEGSHRKLQDAARGRPHALVEAATSMGLSCRTSDSRIVPCQHHPLTSSHETL